MPLLSAYRLAFPFFGGLVLACSIVITRQYHCNSFIQPASFVISPWNTPQCLPVITTSRIIMFSTSRMHSHQGLTPCSFAPRKYFRCTI